MVALARLYTCVCHTEISVNNVYCVVCVDVYTHAVLRECRISNLWLTCESVRSPVVGHEWTLDLIYDLER